MIKMHIEIVSSTMPGFSSMNRALRESVCAVLGRYYSHVSITIINTVSDLEALAMRKPDLVFLGMDFVVVNPALGLLDSRRVWLSAFLDDHNILYTGSSRVAHELEVNKPQAKQRVLDAGLSTAAFFVARQGQQMNNAPLHFPLFVKPTSRGGGMGIDSNSVVQNFKALKAKVASISTDLLSDSLVEEYLPGREFSVAILKQVHSATFSVMPIELVAPAEHGVRVLSEEIKASNTEKAIEITDAALKTRVTELALGVFHALEARDYGRIDIRLDSHGAPHFLEANLLPSLTSGYGSFPKACLINIGLDYEPMILRIVRLALARRSIPHKIAPRDLIIGSLPMLPLKPVLQPS